MLIKTLRQRILLSLWLENKFCLGGKKKTITPKNFKVRKSKPTEPHYRFDCAMSNRSIVFSTLLYIIKALAYYYYCYLITLKYYCYRYHIIY